MGREEQQEEREVLESIFPDEITDISETAYRISVALEVPSHDDKNEGQPTLILHVSCPPNYPDVGPDLDLSNSPTAPRHALLDLHKDKSLLLQILVPTVEENLGMAMVFTLVSALKDAAEQLIAERQAGIQAEEDAEAQRAQEEEDKKFHGTAVTRESFIEWREMFKREMKEEEERRKEEKEAEEKKKRGSVKEEKKLTGKQIWERGLAGKGEDEEVDEGGDGLEGVERLRIER